MSADLVELVDADGSPCGAAPRRTVHGAETPLHRGFSCHLTDHDGRMLMTRRALTKRTWPGVWTNSFCGHPRPGESTTAAIHRYSRHELGVDVAELTPLLPDFRYRAVDASGVVENELCPVFGARLVGSVRMNPLEVVECTWALISDVKVALRATPWAFSPWFVAQMNQLEIR
ncbi:isopentenyl-diphosphate Delta-isomerase [Williamsia herbipolensis]|uniref:Isopentenyl-diphosphate Delta-isomerase n=1 Tax=Williamsia herbipolensis TaxID=1603258 RepID=A0AAU4JZ43_9NOCA|nr:isopentenyl-diphosphate Delta-isomerase [Williamsia herbipolensis]